MTEYIDHRDICSFCAEIASEIEHNLFYQMVSQDLASSYLLLETENFVVMPSIGSLMPGYLLVVPRAHVLSFGHLPVDCAAELRTILELLEKRIAEIYQKKVIFFEHGSASFTERGGSCTDHAHMHIVPVPTSVDLIKVMERDFVVHQIDSLVDISHYIQSGHSYLFLRHHDGRMLLCDGANAKSQHLRRDLVDQLGLGEVWDWLVFPGSDHILKTIRDLTGRFIV